MILDKRSCLPTLTDLFHRQVPNYQNKPAFELVDVRLMFRSPAWRGRNAVKRGVELVVNSSRWLQEFHEENLCHLMPPYGVDYELQRK